MAKVRNVSEHTLTVLGRTVAPDEVVEFADDEFSTYAWPETLWAAVSTPRKSNKE